MAEVKKNNEEKHELAVFVDYNDEVQQYQAEKQLQHPEQQQQQRQLQTDPLLKRKRYLSLMFLSAQSAFTVLVTRYSRTMPGERYFSTTAVCVQEVIKLFASIFMILFYEGGIRGLITQVKNDIISEPWDNLRVGVPAVLYVVQNNLFYVAISNLPAATYQVVFQTRIITTALFAVLILKQKLSGTKWLSLFLLTLGIAAVQIETTVSSDAAKDASPEYHNPIAGFIAIVVMCLTSGFSGVYFEKILKQTQVSVWLRNIQLATFGLILGIAGVYYNDGLDVVERGFFHGYNRWTMTVIFSQALGGLIIACVVKYADNILKGFATSIAVIISCSFSVVLFDFHLTPIFVFGSSIVICSACLYNSSK